MNDLEKYFLENTDKVINKWKHYFDIYDRYFSKYIGTDVHVVEFGVSHGGSLQMWKNYFGRQAKLWGIDINPHCKKLEEDQIEIFIGDQADRQFLQSIAETVPKIDILIDDGGHTMEQQINTFDVLFPYIDKNGVYLCEDTHTSYWLSFGGGYKRRGTFIEYSKNLIDYIHAWHTDQRRRFNVNNFTNSVESLHYYDSILVIEKKPIEKPRPVMTGCREIPLFEPPVSFAKCFKNWLQRKLYRIKDSI